MQRFFGQVEMPFFSLDPRQTYIEGSEGSSSEVSSYSPIRAPRAVASGGQWPPTNSTDKSTALPRQVGIKPSLVWALPAKFLMKTLVYGLTVWASYRIDLMGTPDFDIPSTSLGQWIRKVANTCPAWNTGCNEAFGIKMMNLKGTTDFER